MTTRKRRKNGIQQCRKAAGFKTAADLSKQTEIPQNTIESWEQGFSFPRPEQLISLADLFDCSIDELYGRDPKPATIKDAKDELISVRDLNDSGRRAIELLLKILRSGNTEVYVAKMPDLMAQINSSLAQKQGDGGDSAIRAAAI